MKNEEELKILEIYIQDALDTTNKRINALSIFSTLISLVLSYAVTNIGLVSLLLSIMTLLLSIICALYVYSFRKSNKVKFEVIYEMFDKYELFNPYKREYEKMGKAKLKLTTIEMLFVIVLGLFSLLIIVLSILNLIK